MDARTSNKITRCFRSEYVSRISGNAPVMVCTCELVFTTKAGVRKIVATAHARTRHAAENKAFAQLNEELRA